MKDFDILEKLVFSTDDKDKRLGLLVQFMRTRKRSPQSDTKYYVDLIKRAMEKE